MSIRDEIGRMGKFCDSWSDVVLTVSGRDPLQLSGCHRSRGAKPAE